MKASVVAAVLALVATAALAANAPELTAAHLRSKLNAYLIEYEPKLSELIADELMVQENRRGDGLLGGIGPPEYQTIRSEVAFIGLPGGAGWMGFRRVMKVGSNDIPDDDEPLTAMLAAGARDDYFKARKMLADSARLNLGSPRTTNLPNLPLEVLHPRHAHRFSVRTTGKARAAGRNTTKLVLVENSTPTIIHAYDGGDMRSIVAAYLDAETGVLWRADVITRDPRDGRFAFDYVLSVEFQNNRALGIAVPSKMHEDFFAGINRKAFGDARYTNYRRFQTAARIIPQ
jgi:hypothetical protein